LAAAKEIGVHFIMSLPDNYDFDVKERGVMLSSGNAINRFLRA
jgi:ABC-type multidrug transport system fused ATPase/permease subunit